MDMTQLEKDWVQSLPASIREALTLNEDSLNDFAGNTRRAEALSSLCFRRAINGLVANEKGSGNMHTVEIGDVFAEAFNSVDNEEVSARLDLALRANKHAADMKHKRLEMLKEYTEVTDVPQDAALIFEVVETPKSIQKERLTALGFYEEADAMEMEEEDY